MTVEHKHISGNLRFPIRGLIIRGIYVAARVHTAMCGAESMARGSIRLQLTAVIDSADRQMMA